METLSERELNLLLTTVNFYRDAMASLPDEKRKALPTDLQKRAAELESLREKILEKLMTF